LRGSPIVKRVVILGSESTGKTTLAAELASHFHTVSVPEFVRGYLDARGAPLDASDVEPIARGQIAVEERLLAAAKRLLILDTDLISTEVYAQHYYGVCPEWISRAATERRADLYLLTDIDVAWTPDPQRDRPLMRAEMQALFRDALERRGFAYTEIRGDWVERRAAAIAAVEEVLKGKGQKGE
jgi:NadR type nicotinamide-nucleotide adenylyltransferase